MNVIYFISAVVIIRLLYSIYKSTTTKSELSESNDDAIEEPITRNSVSKNPTQKLNTSEPATKNKWLYPTDEFGRLEKGTIYDSESVIAKTTTEHLTTATNKIEEASDNNSSS